MDVDCAPCVTRCFWKDRVIDFRCDIIRLLNGIEIKLVLDGRVPVHHFMKMKTES